MLKSKWKCIECGLWFKTRKQLREHNKVVHKHFRPGPRKGFTWNKGLTKETSVLVARIGNKVSCSLKKAYQNGKITGRCNDPEKEKLRKQKISLSMRQNPTAGGIRQGAGRGYKGWYKGVFCDSSWELAVVIYWLEHNIKFIRCHEGFKYQFDNEYHLYYPDFKFPTGEYIEIKGNEKSLQWKAKLDQFPKDKILIVIGLKEINLYLNYVKTKYGNNFIKLYEK